MMSVLMATHNGADTIERSLTAMTGLDSPGGGWELILVNNASTDATEARALAFRDRLPLTYLVEKRLGKSFALNTGLDGARGDLIVMTDDDVLPEPGWLTELQRVANAYPQCAIFGGAIVPEFCDGPPRDVPAWCYGVLYGASPSHAEGEIQPMRGTGLYDISGANLAIRRAVRDAGCRFDGNFLVGANGLMGEDTEFVRQAGAMGFKVGFAPSARIGHIIHRHQTSWRWIHRRFFRHGHTAFLQAQARGEATGFPWRQIRGATGSALRYLLALGGRDKANAFRQSRALAYDLGAIHQALSSSRRAR
jgi:glycosyltransferase involved in cell wall biosynthesis